MNRPHFALPLLAALAVCTCPAAAQDVDSKEAKMAKPKSVDLSVPEKANAFIPPPNNEAFFNQKQQRLGDHHRPVPIRQRPAKGPGPKAMIGPATSVINPLVKNAQSTHIVVNRALTTAETSSDTSNVGEPSVAVRGREVLITGNWFAAFSNNGGSTFKYVSPFNAFPPSAQGRFCCDQVAFYDKKHDLMIWLLQYVRDDHGNTLRLAVAHKDEIPALKWHYYDFTPKGIGGWTDEWLDFPDMAVTDGYLYVSSNLYQTGDEEPLPFTRAVSLRVPLDKLVEHDEFDYRYFTCTDVGAPRPAQSVGGDTMHFGAHFDTETIHLYTWKEAETKIHVDNVTVEWWSAKKFSAPDPDGRDWLGREDGRITAAWATKAEIGFAWTAAQDSNFSHPHVRVAIVDKKTTKAKNGPHLWNDQCAYAYAAASPNSEGEVGIAVHYGGINYYPCHCIGKLLADRWELITTAAGKYGPADGKWGDYQAVRLSGSNQKEWVATGFTLKSGPLRTDVELRLIQFK